MRKNFFLGIVFVLLGVLFLLDNLGIADSHQIFHDYWPLLIIAWGLNLLSRKRKSSGEVPHVSSTPTDQELVHESSIFGNLIVANLSQQFKGGSISTVFGNSELDLSHASFADGEHKLRCHSIFGDSRIILPERAAVAVSIRSLFGEVRVLQQQRGGFFATSNIASPEYDKQTHRLKISVDKIFGNTNIG